MKIIEYFNAVYVIYMPDQPKRLKRILRSVEHFYPGTKVIQFEATNTRSLGSHHFGCAMSHRRVIEHAKQNNFKKILIFEEDAILHKRYDYFLPRIIGDIEKAGWDMVKFGGQPWGAKFQKVPRCRNIENDTHSTCTQSIAVNSSVYDFILRHVPENMDDLIHWIKTSTPAIDQWYMTTLGRNNNFKYYISTPRIVTQDILLGACDKQQDYYFPGT